MYSYFKHVFLLSLFLLSSTHICAGEVLEEIVVTAGLRDSKLMKSAGSISVLNEQTVKDRAAHHFEDTINVLPNVSFSGGGTRARFVQIRGVGDLEQFVDPKHFPSVGITIDGIEIGTTAGGALLMDVAQIEVLRGPQGTAFGANALAGIINIQTEEPTDSPSAQIETGYSNFDSWHVGAKVNGPLSDSVGARLAIQQNKSDGYYRNSFVGRENTNKRDELSFRGKLKWSGNDDAELTLITAYSDLDGGYDAFSLDNVRTTISDNPGNDKQETLSLALKGSWPVLKGLTLETMLSWINSDEDYAFDEDWVFSGFCDGIRCDPLFEFSSTDSLIRERDVFALDFRLKSDPGSFSWVAGIYAQKRDEDLQRQHFVAFSNDYETGRYALYAQLQWELSEDWNLTTGFRYEHFEDDYVDSNNLITNSSDGYWSGQLNLEYFYSDNTLFYATLSRSVKPGGVNTDTSSNFPIVDPMFQTFLLSRQAFSAETLFNKEVGLKSRFFDDRLSLSLSLFHMNQSKAQLESFIFDASSFVFTSFLDSTSDAENYGLELELNYRLNSRAAFFAHLGYLETSVDELNLFELDTSQFISRRDRDQAKSPKWQYNLGLNMDFNERLHGRIEIEGRDDSFFGYYHNGKIDGYTLAHASLSYDLGRFTIQGWVRNIFDKDFEIHGLYFANDPRDGFAINRSYYQFGEPRVYGVNVSYTF
ncbi:MAG: TonB-dependent receptor [Gammaproteobacteria bacterium]|nr:TonB-dependent receptor [Gammaproteobacteria bacterium]